MRKTPWFPATIKPVRVGLYMCRRLGCYSLGDEMLLWDGEIWRYPMRSGCMATMSPEHKWLGLTRQPL